MAADGVTHVCTVCHKREAAHEVKCCFTDYTEMQAHICEECYSEIAASFIMSDDGLARIGYALTIWSQEGALEAFKTFCWYWSIGFEKLMPQDIETKAILERLVGQPIKMTMEFE